MPEIINGKGTGWKEEPFDSRDFKFSALAVPEVLESVSLYNNGFNIPPIYDQDSLGSCTGNASAKAVQFLFMNQSGKKSTNPVFFPSRLFIYYQARKLEGSENEDSGAYIRDAIKSIATVGVPSEYRWAYDIKKYAYDPSPDAYQKADRVKAFAYFRINNQNKAEIVTALKDGNPVVFGFRVYESFYEAGRTGIVKYPGQMEEVIGGHAVIIFEYNAQEDYFVVANSWGDKWGRAGYFIIPAAYLTNPQLASDFWVIKSLIK